MSDVVISIWRCPVSGEFNPTPVPMLWICTASDAECEMGDSGEVVEAMASSIWFLDRKGWRVAWRAARKIRSGLSVIQSDLPQGVRIRAHFSTIHFNKVA